jgi:GTP-binding protein
MVIRDLVLPGERVVVAKGGSGGLGSKKVKEATLGGTGEEKTVILELKMVADAGIIGFPNAGKSTLVSRISKAHSKIASYPFTTRSPKLGVVGYHEDSFVVADMPGIIEGAHSGKGLGDRFLRHIERTRVLVHLVDMAPVNGTNPYDNFIKLEEELKLYDIKIYNKPRIVVASKMDVPESRGNLQSFTKKIGSKVYPVAAITGEGLTALLDIMYEEIQNVKKEIETDND